MKIRKKNNKKLKIGKKTFNFFFFNTFLLISNWSFSEFHFFPEISTLKTLGVDAKSALEEILGAKEYKSLICLGSIYMSQGLMEQCVQTVQGGGISKFEKKVFF